MRHRAKLFGSIPDSIRDGAEQSVADYRASRRKFFSLPGIAPGAILHISYRTTWKEFPFPHVSQEIPIELEVPVSRSHAGSDRLQIFGLHISLLKIYRSPRKVEMKSISKQSSTRSGCETNYLRDRLTRGISKIFLRIRPKFWHRQIRLRGSSLHVSGLGGVRGLVFAHQPKK